MNDYEKGIDRIPPPLSLFPCVIEICHEPRGLEAACSKRAAGGSCTKDIHKMTPSLLVRVRYQLILFLMSSMSTESSKKSSCIFEFSLLTYAANAQPISQETKQELFCMTLYFIRAPSQCGHHLSMSQAATASLSVLSPSLMAQPNEEGAIGPPSFARGELHGR